MRGMRRWNETDYAYREALQPVTLVLSRRVCVLAGIYHPLPAPFVVRVDLVFGAAVLLLDEDGMTDTHPIAEDRVVGCWVGVFWSWVKDGSAGGEGWRLKACGESVFGSIFRFCHGVSLFLLAGFC